MTFEEPRFTTVGDHYVLVGLGDDASLALNFLTLGLAAALRDSRLDGVIDVSPVYNSLLIDYDPDRIGFADLGRELAALVNGLGPADSLEIDSRLLYLPVLYLDPWTQACIEDYREKIGPREYDPAFVARLNGLEGARELVRRHAGTEHWVATVGSIPGLPMLRPLDPRCTIFSPKYNPPRTWTPQGAIGIGGASTSIYTVRSPGGYNLIGRTPVLVFDKSGRYQEFDEGGVLLRPADRVRFVPIGREEFDDIERHVQQGTYEYGFAPYQKFSVAAYTAWVATLQRPQ